MFGHPVQVVAHTLGRGGWLTLCRVKPARIYSQNPQFLAPSSCTCNNPKVTSAREVTLALRTVGSKRGGVQDSHTEMKRLNAPGTTTQKGGLDLTLYSMVYCTIATQNALTPESAKP